MSGGDPRSAVAAVRAYYEHNTRLFGAFSLRRSRTIHRAIWADGVATKPAALGYITRLIADSIRQAAIHDGSPLVLDLGCGVGGPLLDLLRQIPSLRGVGVSISPAQVRLARHAAISDDLIGRCSFSEADFTHLPCGATFDAAYAIEALVHAPSWAQVIEQAAGALRPGGRLLVCDDFLTSDDDRAGDRSDWIRAFRRGWRANGLVSLATAIELARTNGLDLIAQRDLTSDLRLLRLPLPIATLLLWLGRCVPERWAFTQSLIGGLALQLCLRHRIIAYQWLVFKKR